MRFCKIATVTIPLLVALSTSAFADHDTQLWYKAPFHNARVFPGGKIYVDYSFDPLTQVLRCTNGHNDSISSIEFAYKDAARRMDLPITLKDTSEVNGTSADPSGRLVIVNDFVNSNTPDGSMYASCDIIAIKDLK